jgi:hypothetical protein
MLCVRSFSMLRIYDLHTELIGKICKLTSFGVELEKEYEQVFGVGNYHSAQTLFEYCHCGNKYELSLMFIDEKPIKRNGVVWYCLKEIGKYSTGDYYWVTLCQVMICSEFSE